MRHESEYELLSEGHTAQAQAGQPRYANAEQTELPGDANTAVPKGHVRGAKPRQPTSRGAASPIAPKGHRNVANPLLPDSEGKAKSQMPKGQNPSANPSLTECSGDAKANLPQGHMESANPLHTTSLAEGHADHADKAIIGVPDASETITAIRAWHRKRVFVMETRKRADLALGSSLRSWLGWRRDNDKALNERIKDLASKLIECGERVAKFEQKRATASVPDKAKVALLASAHPLVDTEEWKEYGDIIMAAILSRGATDAMEKTATKEMERLATSLPVWAAFGDGVRGFGARSLAVIIGEAGDLNLYATKSKLWKRMGLAVMDGVRQGGLSKNAKKEDWIAHGYNAKRRSQMFVIGDVLVKQGEYYRQVYLARKEFERAKAEAAGMIVAPSAKIPEKRKHEFISDGHIHRKAQRYMEKRLLRDLWQAWRASRGVAVVPYGKLPANSIEDAA